MIKKIKSLIATFTLVVVLSPSISISALTVNNELEKVKIINGEKYEQLNYGDILKNQKEEKESKTNMVSIKEGSIESSLSKEVLERKINTKKDAMKYYKILKPKTKENYEVVLAHKDGSYSYVKSESDLESAISKTKELENLNLGKDIIPTVISKDGTVTYATNAMGRVWVHENGQGTTGTANPVNIYNDQNKSRIFTYIDQMSVDDVALINDTGKMAEIQVSGNRGWVNKDTTQNKYDLVVVPINQVTNPSFYYKENGFLYHYISVNMTAPFNGVNYYDIELGQAPDFMKEGVHYLSYDAKYFYDGTDIQLGLNNLLNDLKAGNSNNAINKNNPYYNYYMNLPFRTKSAFTAKEFNEFLANDKNVGTSSKLLNIGEALIKAQDTYGVNASLILGVAINESEWGNSKNAKEKNNIFGIGANDGQEENAFTYASVNDCINDFAKKLISMDFSNPAGKYYYGGILGNKNRGANVNYASDPFWGEKAAQYVNKVDYRMSGRNFANLREKDRYQLATFKGINTVTNDKDEKLYDVIENVFGYGSYIDTIIPLCNDSKVYKDNVAKYRINPEINKSMWDGDNINVGDGIYNWNEKGYVNTKDIYFINKRNTQSPIYNIEDVNGDGLIDIKDISLVAKDYNKASTIENWDNVIDVNKDNIIDIYDVILISIKL